MKIGNKKKEQNGFWETQKKKKIIMRRKPKVKTDYSKKPIKKPWGGHLPFPPKDCAKKKHIFISDNGIPWIDFGICINCTEYPKGCPRKQEYLVEMKRSKKEYLDKNNKKEK